MRLTTWWPKVFVNQRDKICLIAALLSLFLTTTVQAQEGLTGRSVTFSILTFDDPRTPLFQSRRHSAVVVDGIEFGVGREGAQNDLDAVPVLVDISDSRIEINYSIADTPTGLLASARFNGYVLDFHTDCKLFGSASVDRGSTNVPFTNDRLSHENGVLSVNVAGIAYTRESRIVIDVQVNACATS